MVVMVSWGRRPVSMMVLSAVAVVWAWVVLSPKVRRVRPPRSM